VKNGISELYDQRRVFFIEQIPKNDGEIIRSGSVTTAVCTFIALAQRAEDFPLFIAWLGGEQTGIWPALFLSSALQAQLGSGIRFGCAAGRKRQIEQVWPTGKTSKRVLDFAQAAKLRRRPNLRRLCDAVGKMADCGLCFARHFSRHVLSAQ